MNIATVLRDRALESGEQAALIEAEMVVSFAGLDRMAAGIARQLRMAQIRAGDRILVFCPMSVALYAVLVGIWRCGATAVFLDPSTGRAQLERCCALASPRAFIAVPRAHTLRVISRSIRSIPIAFSIDRWLPWARRLTISEGTIGVGSANTATDGPSIAVADDNTPALITFTSGSTGQPKAAVRTHGFLLAQHRVLAHDLNLRAGQRDLAALPIFVLANLASGVTSIIPDADLRAPGEVEPARLNRQIRHRQPTRVAASPALLDRLATHAALQRQELDTFEEIYTGGAPVFPRLLRLLQQVAPRAAVVAVYGSTEAEPIARVAWNEIQPEDLRAMQGGAGLLVGHPIAEIDLRILPDRWGQLIGPYSGDAFDHDSLPSVTPGEVVVAGEHVLTGYLDGFGDNETKFQVNGRTWHRTGDAGYLDRIGRLWLLGRASAKLVDPNGVVYPFAVECAVMSNDSVRRCALVQLDGDRVLVVELEPNQSAGVVTNLQRELSWARVTQVRVVDKIPVDKRHNAKVDYPTLRTMLER
jgi:acyl-CoA synthetase (AMP-forming)/AMP-acid ligase II